MKYGIPLSLFALSLPFAASAQGIQIYLITIIEFFNEILIPFLIAIALLIFLWNMVRYFIIESADSSGREKARRLAIWGILAFFLILFLWGIVNIFAYMFGISRSAYLCPDYVENCDPTTDPQFSDFFDITGDELEAMEERLRFERAIREAEEQDPGFYGER